MTDSKEERIRKLDEVLVIAERAKNSFMAANIREALLEVLKEV